MSFFDKNESAFPAMNPLIKMYLGTWLRAALVGLTVYLRTRGVVTDEQGKQLQDSLFTALMELLPAALAIGLSMWQKYQSRRKLMTAQAMGAGVTEHEVEMVVRQGMAPDATLPKSERPVLNQ